MHYQFSFYKYFDYERLVELVLRSYEWEYPVVGLSRIQFSKGLHPAFTGHQLAWQHTVGVYRENGEIVACVWNEGNYSGDVFFLFDSKARGEDPELLKDMIKFAKTNNAGLQADRKTRFINLFVPKWNHTLRKMVEKSGFVQNDWGEHLLIQPFSNKRFEVVLPEGYQIIDGYTSPDFFLSNTHRLAFGYGENDYACEHGEQAFHDLRQMKYYNPKLDLCVTDEMGRPVAMAILWYDKRMPYCELEPLAVAWWERRKGIATAILHEGANRVMESYPECRGMLGGDQDFYRQIGYQEVEDYLPWHWEAKIYISWEKESLNMDYAKEVE